jgi:hypothetical protein
MSAANIFCLPTIHLSIGMRNNCNAGVEFANLCCNTRFSADKVSIRSKTLRRYVSMATFAKSRGGVPPYLDFIVSGVTSEDDRAWVR